MTLSEFSNGFDTLCGSFRRFKDFDKQEVLDSIEFNEYEKSLYLTMSQDELVVNFYNGHNIYGSSFESTEEMRRYLDVLVKDATGTSTSQDVPTPLAAGHSYFFQIPSDVMFIVYENVTRVGVAAGCDDNCDVKPVTHDEYNRLRRNPFRGASRYKALRLDVGDNLVEIISKYNISEYHLRYISEPKPIILENLRDTNATIKGEIREHECALPEILHDVILRRAVQLALASKGITIENNK